MNAANLEDPQQRYEIPHEHVTPEEDGLASGLASAHVQLEETTRAYPWGAMAVAVGVGVVLGGGVPTWALRLAAASATRIAAAHAVQALITPSHD